MDLNGIHENRLWGYSEGVFALRVHCVRTAATIPSEIPVNHPKMYPPKQPIEPQKTPVFLGFFLVAQNSWRLLGTFRKAR